MDGQNRTEIYGTVVTVIFQNAENGYTVLRLETEDGLVTAVGCMPGAAVGEELVLQGTWTTHTSYGEQFKAELAQRRMPEGANAIFRYLATGAIKYIGPAKAKEIVDMFGDDTLNIIENSPERLAEIRGISEKRAREIGNMFRRQISLRRLMEYLSAYSIIPAVALGLYRAFGDDAIDAVKNNPYILTMYGAEFFEADAMALQIGFEGDCPERVEAAILFELSHNLNNGHTFLPHKKLVDATDKLIGAGTEIIEESVSALCEGGYIIEDGIAGLDACYLAEIYEAEKNTAEILSDMARNTSFAYSDAETLIEKVQEQQGVVYSEGQRRAVELAASNRVLVLTGGPGTGKTTSVRAILTLFDIMQLKTALCAPTGRAAKRMSEVCLRDAATIHRLLGAMVSGDDKLVFEHDEADPLDADAVIVDEASMIDINLMDSLMRALKPGCRLVLVGDANQLPSVGPGNVFSDIIRSEKICTVKLTEIFRQAQESKIVRSAHQINSGKIPELKNSGGDFFFLRRCESDRAAETVLSLCAERLPDKMGFSRDDIQVLTPTRKYETGTENLNKALQNVLNPAKEGKKEKEYGNFIYREGDKVMQIRNNYDIMWKTPDGRTAGMGVFNGDIGKIIAIDYQHETVTVDYDDKRVDYLYEQLGELEPAYAMTVHKSQGSEYNAVVLVLCAGAPQLLARSVLYTAVTRAKKLLVIVGDDNVVSAMVENDRRQRRYSGLRYRLANME